MAKTPPRVRVTKRHRDANYQREANNWYVEEPWCWDCLFDLIPIRGGILDPAAGRGTLIEVARRRGFRAFGTDLVKRADTIFGGLDFLDEDYPLLAPFRVENVISNPPYGPATVPFIRRALRVASRQVAVLVQAPFLYSQGRYGLFTGAQTRPSHIIHLSRRPSMPPGDLLVAGEVEARGGKEDYCIVVWTRGWRIEPVTLWAKP